MYARTSPSAEVSNDGPPGFPRRVVMARRTTADGVGGGGGYGGGGGGALPCAENERTTGGAVVEETVAGGRTAHATGHGADVRARAAHTGDGPAQRGSRGVGGPVARDRRAARRRDFSSLTVATSGDVPFFYFLFFFF